MATLSQENAPLIFDFVDWIAQAPRRYDEVMDVWRTSCPRLTIYEDAVDRGLVCRRHTETGGTMIEATEAGHLFLREFRRGAESAAA